MVQVILRDGGRLFEGKDEDLTNKEYWNYINYNASGSIALVDRDGTKAAPMVKSILNEMDLFPEMKMLKIINIILSVLFIFVFLMFLMMIMRLPSVKNLEDVKTQINTKLDNYNTKIDPKEAIKTIIQKNSQGTIEK